jgi:hypothetical protein
VMSSEMARIAAGAAVAAGLGYLVWRSGLFDGRRPGQEKRSDGHHYLSERA